MQLVCITDLHGHAQALEQILAHAGRGDLLLLGGDITSFGEPADAERLVRGAQASGMTVLAVAGNCDSLAIEERLGALGVGLHGRGVMVGEVGIHGLSATPPWRRRMYHLSEEQLAAALESGYRQIAAAARHVILAHVPPYDGRLDCTYFFQHVGSTALRSFIDRTQPTLVVCGHIHEARGVETIGRTVVVNCGVGGTGYYAWVELEAEVRVELRRA